MVALMAVVRFTPAIVEQLADIGVGDVQLSGWWQPLGVAVMALQVISYIIDVDRTESPVGTFAETVLVIGFFPRSFAGPIVRSGNFIHQLRSTWDGRVPLGEVSQRLMSAVIKSYVLAETLLRYEVATSGTNVGTGRLDSLLHLAVGPLRFFIDISALTDLAIAAGLCCGLRLPENFKAPFKATTVGGLFRGWHTTISGFFRDYVFVNIAGMQASPRRVFAAALVTLTAIGTWHMFAPGPILWGVAMGLPIGIELGLQRHRRASRARKTSDSQRHRIWRLLGRVGTFAYMALISPLYNAWDTSVRIWPGLLNGWTATRIYTPWVFGCAVVAYCIGSGSFAEPARRLQHALDGLPAWAVGAVTAVVVTAAVGLAGAGVPTFLYQRM